ncbi:Transporter [Rhodopirellula islandica]|uniref:Transporter n=1 Tax=Rhodopirellula islandica TaxID=595434 RepID=A0A0J1B9J4_RHOIS|nr:Transporter [Rhodopirellula islandica]
MTESTDTSLESQGETSGHHKGGARRAIVRGLGVVLPPLLTIVVLIWAWNAIENYVLLPVETGIRRFVLIPAVSETYEQPPEGSIINDSPDGSQGKLNQRGFTYKGLSYVPDPTGRRFLPGYVVQRVDSEIDAFGPAAVPPNSAMGYWDRFVQLQYMPRSVVVPVFLIVFFMLLYFLGRLFTGGIGRWFVTTFDAAILRIPIVNKVYGSVKQITDFAFDDRQIEFNRVVAIQYPRDGIWSLGFVTGNGMREVSEAAGEPMLSVLMPTSPMPMTGFTVSVRRSEAIDLNLTIDEALQFIVSCGVVVPINQRYDLPGGKPAKQIVVPAIGDAVARDGATSPSA